MFLPLGAAGSGFFGSLPFGITALVIVGSSWCLIGLIMGDAPKRKIEPGLVQLLGALISALASAVILAFQGMPPCSGRVFLYTSLAIGGGAFMNFFMLQLMSYAMQRGPNGVIWAIIQSALIFPFLGGVVFFGVQLTVLRTIGILLLLLALAAFALTKDNSKNQGGWKLPAFICLGICAIQQNLTTAPSYFEESRAVTSVARALVSAVGVLLAALCYTCYRWNPEYRKQFLANLRTSMLWKYVLGLQFFNLFFAYTLFYPGMDIMATAGRGGMCYPLMVGSCIISFTLTAVLLLKERMHPLQAAALGACLGGLIFLCM